MVVVVVVVAAPLLLLLLLLVVVVAASSSSSSRMNKTSFKLLHTALALVKERKKEARRWQRR
jgi:hypothetical protein